MFSKKAQELPIKTLVTIIIILVVLAVVILFFSKYSGSVFKSFSQNINSILNLSK